MLKSGPTPRTVTLAPSPLVAVDRHAGNALQRFGQVGVGEFADVFGHDAVDDTVRIALQVHRRGHTAADTGHHHGLRFITSLNCLRFCYRILTLVPRRASGMTWKRFHLYFARY
jgi:hypothetical protein